MEQHSEIKEQSVTTKKSRLRYAFLLCMLQPNVTYQSINTEATIYMCEYDGTKLNYLAKNIQKSGIQLYSNNQLVTR